MASEVKTNKISPATSTTINVGDSGDTLALAVDDVTGFNVGSDAAGDILYHDGTDYTRLAKPGTPADEVLTFATSATAPSWVAAAAGNTHASQWRLTTSFDNSVDPITTNLEAVIAADPATSTASPTSSTALGAPMTVSSGIFTFPVTGYWLVAAIGVMDWETYDPNPGGIFINFTDDDSAYAGITKENAMVYLGYYGNSNASVVLDITDTSLCKVSFGFVARGATDTCIGDAAKNSTCMSFVRLGDT
jgi:hypothetical protein